MTNVNIGPVARATKWRKRYVGVWFGLLISAELAAISLTKLEYYKIAEATLWLIAAPLLLLYEQPAFLITIPILFLLFRLVMRFKITALIILSVVYLISLIWPLFYSFSHYSRTDTDIDQYWLIAVFALPGFVASLMASLNEIRYRAVSTNLPWAGDLNLTLKQHGRSNIFTLPDRSILKVLGPSALVVVIVLVLVIIIGGFDSGSARAFVSAVVGVMGWVSYMVHKRSVRTAEDVAKNDERPPILILRSFKEDPRLARPGGYPYTSLVDRVGQLLQSVGPRVALPEPGFSLPYPDIAEVRTEKTGSPDAQNIGPKATQSTSSENTLNTDWKNEFYRYIGDSILIVVFIAGSPGLLWEIEELLTRPEILQRTILIFSSSINAQENAKFIRFLLLLDKFPVAESLYHLLKSWPRTSTAKQRFLSLDPCSLDKFLPHSYLPDEPLLIRFSKSGNPVVILGPIVWEGYEVAFKRYVLNRSDKTRR